MNRIFDFQAVPLLPVAILVLLAFSLVALAIVYRHRGARPLPRRVWLQWMPKYRFEVPVYAALNDTDAVRRELTEWLDPLGFEWLETPAATTKSEPTTLVYERYVHWLGSGGTVQVIIELPVTNPVPIVIQYRTAVIVDTGDLAACGQELLDKEEADHREEESVTAFTPDSGNPYQAPNFRS